MNDKIREALEIGKGYIEAELVRRKEAMAGYSHRWVGVERDLAAVDAALSTHQAAAELPALPSKASQIPSDPTLKVARRCPRCRLTGYYFTDAAGVRNRMSCSNCGHLWAGRVTLYERGGERP